MRPRRRLANLDDAVFHHCSRAVTNPKREHLVLAALCLVAFAAAVACNGDGAPAEGTPAATATADSQVADVLPEDFPVYPGARLVDSQASEDQLTASYETDDSRQQVVDFYEPALFQARWRVDHILDPNDQEDTTIIVFGERENLDNRGTITTRDDPSGERKTEIIVELVFPSGITPTATPAAE